jgi:hypothetical protein
MIPVQMIRVGVGDETIQVPVFRLPYVGGQDAFTPTGGFFVDKEGAYGVLVDARVPLDEVATVATAEVRKNLAKLNSLVSEQFAKLKGAQPSQLS